MTMCVIQVITIIRLINANNTFKMKFVLLRITLDFPCVTNPTPNLWILHVFMITSCYLFVIDKDRCLVDSPLH